MRKTDRPNSGKELGIIRDVCCQMKTKIKYLLFSTLSATAVVFWNASFRLTPNAL